jgi:predicted RNA binding protein YcfA (HicA-like mRNA interferase family)
LRAIFEGRRRAIVGPASVENVEMTSIHGLVLISCCESYLLVINKQASIEPSGRLMLTNSRDIIRRLEREGWRLVRITGSHHHFAKDGCNLVTVPHPKRDMPTGTVRNIYKQAGWAKD